MKIDLQIVRQVLKDALGFNSFVAGFVTEILKDPKHPTAGITKEGLLRYNPEFVDKHVSCKEDLFALLFHELLHPMFGHFIHEGGMIENVACDAIINSVITNLFGRQCRDGSLFKKTHEPTGLNGLMRPHSNMDNTRYAAVYEKLYGYAVARDETLTAGELIQTLKILTPTVRMESVVLLGTHGKEGKSDGSLDGLPKETLARIAEDLRRAVRANVSAMPGYNQNVLELVMEALRTHLSIRRVLLQKFATKRKMDRFKETLHSRRLSTTPIPICPSKRDLVLLASGMNPCYFHNRVSQPKTEHKGLAIYLDVSGSVNEYLPKILGVLKGLRKEVLTIFQFSNSVVETTFESLLKGNIHTTYGTDFDCIAKSILERDIDKAIIITDGYGAMSDDNHDLLKKHHLSTLTILFDSAESCEEFAPFGEVVQLEDVTE